MEGNEPRPPAPLSLVHPATPAAASFSEKHLAPFMSHSATDLLDQYKPVTSRGALVVLHRRHINRRKRSRRRSDLCVYDPMTGERTFLPDPPGIGAYSYFGDIHTYVLLTAAHGIGCSFQLLVAYMTS